MIKQKRQCIIIKQVQKYSNKMRMLIQRLVDEQLYEIIFLLLMVYRDEHYVKNLKDSLLLKMIIKNLNGEENKEQIIKDILRILE